MDDLPDLSSFPTDSKGHIGRECPEEDCVQQFSMKLVDGGLPEFHYCPTCGQQDDYDAFWTPDQLERIDSILGEDEAAGCGDQPKEKPAQTKETLEIFQYKENTMGDVFYCEDCDGEFAMKGEPKHCPACGGNHKD